MQAIVQGIEATDSVPGRGEVIDQGQDFGCVVDGADTPGALTALLTELHEAGARRILTVFGCPGERHKERRPFMGEAAHFKVFSETWTAPSIWQLAWECCNISCCVFAHQDNMARWGCATCKCSFCMVLKIYSLGLQSDIVILTNDNPLGEPPNEIIADIVAGYEDHILNHNAIVPYQPGFLQDPCRLPFTSLEFAMELNYECATLCPSMQCSCPSVLPCSKACLGV